MLASPRVASGLLLRKEVKIVLSYAITFFVISLIAALLGLGGVAGLSYQIGYLFAVLAVIFLIIAIFSGRRPPIT